MAANFNETNFEFEDDSENCAQSSDSESDMDQVALLGGKVLDSGEDPLSPRKKNVKKKSKIRRNSSKTLISSSSHPSYSSIPGKDTSLLASNKVLLLRDNSNTPHDVIGGTISVPKFSPTEVVVEIENEILAKLEDLAFINYINICGFDDNVFVLAVLFCANTSFTFAQLLGAVAADSLSMYGDCATMALDSFTYLLNIYAEKSKLAGTRDAVKLEIFVSTISIAALTSVTAFLLWDAIQRLRVVHPEDEFVKADIMLEFSSVNLLIDIFSCAIFTSKLNKIQNDPGYSQLAQNSVPHGKLNEGPKKTGGALRIEVNEDLDFGVEYIENADKGSHGSLKSLQSLQSNVGVSKGKKGRNLNMASAFLHLSADTLRTITVMITAVIVDSDKRHIDSVDADAIGSIVVSVIILAVAIALCFELAQLAFDRERSPCQSPSSTTS